MRFAKAGGSCWSVLVGGDVISPGLTIEEAFAVIDARITALEAKNKRVKKAAAKKKAPKKKAPQESKRKA
jgi:hypothetical protein